MAIKGFAPKIIPEINSPSKVYDLFRGLGYPEDMVLDPTYKRKVKEFDFSKEEQEKVKEIYTVFNYAGKLQIFLIETTTISPSFVRYLTKRLSERYEKFLLILTTNYREYAFVFPKFESVGEGKHRLKLTILNLDRESPYHSDLLIISSLAIGGEEGPRDIWKIWQDAFSRKKVTDRFFEDYKTVFLKLKAGPRHLLHTND